MTMEKQRACSICGQPAALIPLGVRYGYPHRWRPWITTRTHLYLCACCDALVLEREARPGGGGHQGPASPARTGGHLAACGSHAVRGGPNRAA